MLAFALPALGFAADFDPSHRLYGEVLVRFVQGGLVDYASLKADRGKLDLYLDQLAAVPKDRFKTWSPQERLAFLINLYNASTLRLIIDHYPVKSIKGIGSFFKGPWDQEVVRVFGDTITLNTLEHKIIRPEYREPRAHFALVCAAMGCPPLRGEPYAAAELQGQLDDQGRLFLSATHKNRVDAAGRTVYLSPIFKWYAEDFQKKSGSVLSFVEPYFPEGAAKGLPAGGYSVKYTEYDWSLNERKAKAGGAAEK